MTPGRAPPMTNRLTLVDLPEGRFIADVGFGGQTPTVLLLLDPGPEQATPRGTYRVARDGETFEMQMRVGGRCALMYRFTLVPQSPADFENANWFTSTHPRGRLTRNLVIARVVGENGVNLLGASPATCHPDGSVEQRMLADAGDLGEVLTEVMGPALPVPAEPIRPRTAMGECLDIRPACIAAPAGSATLRPTTDAGRRASRQSSQKSCSPKNRVPHSGPWGRNPGRCC
jgi:arylamine N-acetyltransferase